MENDKLVRLSDVLEILSRKDAPWNGFVNVQDLPTVDAVEVVRCKKCKHYKPSRFNAGTAHYCAVIDGFPAEDWYCADCQRREDGDNGKHL